MNTTTLASAVVRIGIDQSQFRLGLAGVHSQLTGFVGASQLLAGRIAGGLIGGTGQAILAKRAQSMLGPSQAGVRVAENDLAIAKKRLTDAKVEMRDARDQLGRAINPTMIAAARNRIASALVDIRLAQTSVAQTTANLGQAKTAASAAQNAFAGTAAGIGAMATAAAAAVGVTIALTQGLVSVASAGAELSAIEHNLDQAFGSASDRIKLAAGIQADAFGRSKAAFMDYATNVGRQLEVLGVKQDAAARVAADHAEAVSRLAAARQIGFGEAAQAAHSTVTSDEVRGFAIRKGFINAYGEQLNAATEALLRFQLETQKMNEMTAGSAVNTQSWRVQVDMINESFNNLKGTIGKDLQPAFTMLFEAVNAYLQQALILWEQFRKGLEWAGFVGPNKPPDPAAAAAIDQRNAASIEQSRLDREAGAASRMAGGGGGGGGFQGDLGGYRSRIQNAVFNQNTAALQEKQLRVAEAMSGTLGSMLDIMKAGGGPRSNPQVANVWSALGGGLASV